MDKVTVPGSSGTMLITFSDSVCPPSALTLTLKIIARDAPSLGPAS
nr:hypothetical protein [Belnapia arida]